MYSTLRSLNFGSRLQFVRRGEKTIVRWSDESMALGLISDLHDPWR